MGLSVSSLLIAGSLFASVYGFKCSVDADVAFDSLEWDFELLETETANLDGNLRQDYLLYWNVDRSVVVPDAGYSCQKSYACIKTVSNGYFIPSGKKPMCTSLFGDEGLPDTAGKRLLFQTAITNQTDFSADSSTIISATTYIDLLCPGLKVTKEILGYVPELSDPVYLNYISNAARGKPYISGGSSIIKDVDSSGISADYDVRLLLYSFSACPYETKETAGELVIILVILALIFVYLVPAMIIRRYLLKLRGSESYPNYSFWSLFKYCMRLGLKTVMTPIAKLKAFFKVRKQVKMEEKKAKVSQLKLANPYIDCCVPVPFRVQQTLAIPYGYVPPQGADGFPVEDAARAMSSGGATGYASEQSASGMDANDTNKSKNKVSKFKTMWRTAMALMNTKADRSLLPDISSSSVRDRSLSRLFLTSFVDVQFRLALTTKLKIVKIPKNPKNKGYLEARLANNTRLEKLRVLFAGDEEETEGSAPLESGADY